MECAERLKRLSICDNSTVIDIGKLKITASVTAPNPATLSNSTNEVTITVQYEYPSGVINTYSLKTVVIKK